MRRSLVRISVFVLGLAAIGSVFAVTQSPITGIVDLDRYYEEQGNPRYLVFDGVHGDRAPAPFIPPGHVVLKPNAVGHGAPAHGGVAVGNVTHGTAKITGEGGNPMTPTGGSSARPTSDAVRTELRGTLQALGL